MCMLQMRRIVKRNRRGKKKEGERERGKEENEKGKKICLLVVKIL